MDTLPVLESIARVLPGLPAESVEDQLVAFDVLVGVSPREQRPAAAEFLRQASNGADPQRRQRLLQAADDVIASRPCALTPDGRTAAQAAADSTVTKEEWEARIAITPLPPPPAEDPPFEADDDDGEEEDEYLEAPPPALPHLPVRHFFPGLAVRVGRDFVDAQGRTFHEGDLLQLIALERIESGYLLNLIVRTVRLNTSDNRAGIENADNAWFQPVPSVECLRDLCEAIGRALDTAEDDEDDVLDLREEVEACEEWLSMSGERGPTPQGSSAALAAQLFGQDHPVAVWTRLLFAAMPMVGGA